MLLSLDIVDMHKVIQIFTGIQQVHNHKFVSLFCILVTILTCTMVTLIQNEYILMLLCIYQIDKEIADATMSAISSCIIFHMQSYWYQICVQIFKDHQ